MIEEVRADAADRDLGLVGDVVKLRIGNGVFWWSKRDVVRAPATAAQVPPATTPSAAIIEKSIAVLPFTKTLIELAGSADKEEVTVKGGAIVGARRAMLIAACLRSKKWNKMTS